VQPTQLSLVLDPAPTPPLLDQLPPAQTSAVISLLAGLIAKAAAPTATEAGDE